MPGPHPDLVLGVVTVSPSSWLPSQPEASILGQCVQGSLRPGYVKPVMWRERVDIWAKSASPSTKMLQLVKIEILDPSVGVQNY